MGYEELGSLVCQGMSADTKHPGCPNSYGVFLPFAKILPTGLVIKIGTLRKQIHVA